MHGIIDKSVEFFVHDNEVNCMHDGQRYVYSEIPKPIIDRIETDMLQYPEALKALTQWENLAEFEYVRQYIYCRFGGIDAEPDIDVNGGIHHTEYFDCGLRGKCKYEGKLCCSIKVDNGILTKTEMEVLKHINMPDKNIADIMHISEHTVNSHTQNIRIKTGKTSKVELAFLARDLGII